MRRAILILLLLFSTNLYAQVTNPIILNNGVAPSVTYSLTASTTAKCTGTPDHTTVQTNTMNTEGANLLVVCVGSDAVALGTLTTAYGNTYLLKINASVGTGTSGARSLIYECINPGTTGALETFKYVGGAANSYPVITAYAFAKTVGGVTNEPVYDNSNSNTNGTGSGTTIQPGSLTASVVGELLFTFMVNSATGITATINDSYSAPLGSGGDANSEAAFASYFSATSLTAYNPTWSGLNAATGDIAAGHIEFK